LFAPGKTSRAWLSPLPWHLHLPVTKGISKEAGFVFLSSQKELKANGEILHL